MNKLVLILYNINPEISKSEFKEWMQDVDIPGVKKLESVHSHLFGEALTSLDPEVAPKYDFIELMEVSDFDLLRNDVMSKPMQEISEQFMGKLASPPDFVFLEEIQRL